MKRLKFICAAGIAIGLASAGRLRKSRRSAANGKPRAARNQFRAVLLLAVKRADLPIIFARSGLHHLELWIQRKVNVTDGFRAGRSRAEAFSYPS